MIGERIGNYRVTERIGEGGMGTVYRAMDEMLDREVALKVMRPEVSRQPGLHERFRQEAVALARLNHSRIAAVYGLERYNADLVMVMEFVRGETLEAVVHRSGTIAWGRAFELGAEALDGLDHAHTKGVVHRDIKPANLMLARDGHVKVMDFGIARLMGQSRQTRMGAAVGTPMYMSPEQLRGEDVDGRSDCYSLGCVLYELITGRLAFEADSDYELMMKQLNTPAPAVRASVVDAPPVVDDVLQRAMAKSRDDRYPDARAMADALRHAVQLGAAEAPRPARPTRLAEPAPDREVPLASLPVTVDTATPPRIPATRLASDGVAPTRLSPQSVAPTRVAVSGSPATTRSLATDWRAWVGVAALALVATLLLRDRAPVPSGEGAVTPPATADTVVQLPPEPASPPAPVVPAPEPVAVPREPIGEKVGPVGGGVPAPEPRPASPRPAAARRREPAPNDPSRPAPATVVAPTPTPVDPPPRVEPAPVSTPAPTREPAPESAVSAADVGDALGQVAAAMNRGDVDRMTALLRVDGAREWLDLVREKRLQMDIEGTPDIESTGPGRATARFRVSLNVRSAFGANRRRPAQFVAELSRVGDSWRATSVRPVGTVSLK